MAIRRLKLVAKTKVDDASLEVWSDIKALQRQLKNLSRSGINRATYRALNRAANKTKTFTGRLLAKKYNTKVGTFKTALSLSPKANVQSHTVALFASSGRFPIYKYAKGAKRQTPLGVRFNSGGGSKVHKHTFIATMSSGHTGIFVRQYKRTGRRPSRVSPTTGHRYKTHLGIRELEYPSVRGMMLQKDTANEIFSKFVEFYPPILHAQLKHEWKKAQGV